MEFEVLGDATGGPKLRLDWRRFSYAGKFVMTNAGKAVCRDGSPVEDQTGADADAASEDAEAEDADDVVAAVSFNEDRTNENLAWLRYVTVREDRRGEGIGPSLAAFVAEYLLDMGYARVKIAVNNPFAYQALYKAGFGFTGERTGVAELVLARPCASRAANYRRGLTAYRDRDLSAAEQSFLAEKIGTDPPRPVDAPKTGSAD